MRSDQRCYAAPAWGRRADHRFGRIINANIAEYHVPVNADVHEIKVIFVEEPDDSNPLGVKESERLALWASRRRSRMRLSRDWNARPRPADYAG